MTPPLPPPDPLPPEWARVSDLRELIARHFGEIDTTVLRDLKLHLRSDVVHLDLRYRIGPSLGGLTPWGDTPGRLPAGTKEAIFQGQRIAVAINWSSADENMETFAVRGGRLAIFVLWADAERWINRQLDWLDERARINAAAVPPPAQTAASDSAKPTFDEVRAEALLVAEKLRGVFRNKAPTEGETRAFLGLHFAGIPNEPHRRIRRKLWPHIRRGRRTIKRELPPRK